jgi:hypothetical protein
MNNVSGSLGEKRALVLSGGGSKGKLSFLTRGLLEDLYWKQKKSYSEIAKVFNVTQSAIIYHARKLGMKSRSAKTASRMANSGENNPAKRPEVRAKLSGRNNHFYGKTHTEKSKQQMSESQKLWDRSEWTKIRWTEERKREFSKNNPMNNPKIRKKHKEALRGVRHKFTGSNSSRWKGGITEIRQKIRQLAEYKDWRNACIKRDGCICQLCHEQVAEIQVDHIKPFSVILDEHEIDSIKRAIACEELWDTRNGRVLCVECHQNTGTFGGRT